MLVKSTLLLVAALGTLGPVAMPQVNALSHTGAPPARRAEHLNMANKMIKKRGVAPRQNLAPVKRQDDEEEVVPLIPSPSSPAAVSSSTTSAVSSTTTTSSSTTSSISTSTSSTTSTQSSSSTAPPSSSTNTNTSTRTRPSVTPSASEPVEETEEPERSTLSRTRSLGTSTAIVFETTGPSTDSKEDKSKDQEASSIPKPVLIGLVVAAACIATAAALWTVIRKWKFGASRQFEDRLEPVNWEPTNAPPAEAHDPTALAVHRANSVNSHSARSSEEQRVGYGTYGNMNMSSTNNNPVTLAPELPPHDFTAGGHGGYGGYADMQRGPSPAPPSLQRGPSSSQGHGGRDEYGMPNPYDAYDYNSGYNNGYNNGRYNNGPGPHQF